MGEGKRSNWKSTETTAMERYFSTDVLVDILQRLPPSSRRRARLVCRVWRDVVDECTTEMQSRAKPLLWHTGNAVAYVVDDPSSASASARSCRQLWRSAGKGRNSEAVQLVGTCNGLLCLCDDEERVGGALTVINPTTGAKLPIPPLPCAGPLVGHHTTEKWSETKAWHEAYCFAYHPTTGKHKVVHVPCSYERACEFDSVHVLTLGEATWREVPAGPGGAKCNLAAGIVSVDGKTYWIWVTASGVTKVASFDLDDEHVVVSATARPPSLPAGHNSYHLTEVRGRLGFVTRGHASAQAWVLEEEGQRWSRRYILEQRVPLPHFTYAGECVLTVRDGASFYAHRRKDAASSCGRLHHDEDDGVVRVGHEDEGSLVVNMGGYVGDYFRTFAYVKTMESLRITPSAP